MHMVGPHATDLIAEACVALRLETTTEEIFAHDPPAPDALGGADAGRRGRLRPRDRRLDSSSHGPSWRRSRRRPTPEPSSRRRSCLASSARALHFLRLNRMVEEQLANLYRQDKVVGGLYRSLGQEACSVGARLRARARRHLHAAHPQPRRHLRARRHAARRLRAVHGARGRPHRAAATSTSTSAGSPRTAAYIAVISMLGDMIPILAGAAIAERMQGRQHGRPHLDRRRRHLDRRLPRGAQLRLRAEGAARADRREQQVRVLDARPRKQTANTALRRPRARPTAAPASSVDGNDVLAVYEVTRRAIERARRRRGPDADRGRHHAHARPRRARRHDATCRRSCSRSGRARTRSRATSATCSARGIARRRSSTAIVGAHRARARPRTSRSPRRARFPDARDRRSTASTATATVASPVPPLVRGVGAARRRGALMAGPHLPRGHPRRPCSRRWSATRASS